MEKSAKGKSGQKANSGIIRRRVNRAIGVFVDGVTLDRATRRLKKSVDMAALLRGVTMGIAPTVARYYTVLPITDDSRHHAFLDAVAKAGFEVVVKRLPPVGIERNVTADPEMSADIISFTMGNNHFGELFRYLPDYPGIERPRPPQAELPNPEPRESDQVRSVITVCPGRDLSYALALAGELGADTTTCDFSKTSGGDVLKSAAKWIDLSDSTTIWRQEA